MNHVLKGDLSWIENGSFAQYLELAGNMGNTRILQNQGYEFSLHVTRGIIIVSLTHFW